MHATVDDAMFAAKWSHQVTQYPTLGRPGMNYGMGMLAAGHVNCLIWRDSSGYVRGILNHYPVDLPGLERAGNVNLWVAPGWQGTGIGTLLLTAADRRWKIDFTQQTYTTRGLTFVHRYLARGRRCALA